MLEVAPGALLYWGGGTTLKLAGCEERKAQGLGTNGMVRSRLDLLRMMGMMLNLEELDVT